MRDDTLIYKLSKLFNSSNTFNSLSDNSSDEFTLWSLLFILILSSESLIFSLKIPLKSVLQMEIWEYNHWLGFLLNEQEDQEAEMIKARHR